MTISLEKFAEVFDKKPIENNAPATTAKTPTSAAASRSSEESLQDRYKFGIPDATKNSAAARRANAAYFRSGSVPRRMQARGRELATIVQSSIRCSTSSELEFFRSEEVAGLNIFHFDRSSEQVLIL
jgi:hypothetical protein